MDGLKIVLAQRIAWDGEDDDCLSLIDRNGVWHLFNHDFRKVDLRSRTVVLKPGYRLLFHNWERKGKDIRQVVNSDLSKLKIQKGGVFNLLFQNKKIRSYICLPDHWIKSVTDLKTGKVLYENKNPSALG